MYMNNELYLMNSPHTFLLKIQYKYLSNILFKYKYKTNQSKTKYEYK